MAYGELYRFVFDAANGPEVTISVAKKDYTGAVSSRAVGGSAVLKRERSGHILGSSLEWAAECLVEDEFADLYTSDPTLYQVTVKFGASRIWRGFITPELYSAPWVNAPYDITLTASDNLSELKNFDFEEQGDKTVRELLLLLLDKTNQGMTNITAVSSLSGDGESLINLTVNVDALAGSTYYDVLNSLLESLHACIRIDSGTLSWIVSRETDISNYSGISYIALSSLSGSGQLFPVGNISMEISPARKELTVSEEIHAANVAKEFNSTNMLTTHGSPAWSGKIVSLYARLTQTVSGPVSSFDAIGGILFPNIISGRRYRLTFKVRKGNGTGRSVGGPVKLLYGLIVTGSKEESLYYNTDGELTDNYPDDDYPITYVVSSSSFEEYSCVFDVPATVNGVDFTAVRGSLAIKVARNGSTTARNWAVLAQVTAARLEVDDFPDGLATRIILDNSARAAGDEVNLQFGADMAQARLNAIREKKFTSAAITTAQDFNAFMAIDNALSVATPRLRLSGIVMFKTAAAWRLPEFVRTTHTTADNLDYIVEQYSFNLITGDIDISMISLPAAALAYKEIKTTSDYKQIPSGSSTSGAASGTQGPKGDTGAAAGFATPTAEAFFIAGGDPTAEVTASGPDTAKKFAFKFWIPKASEVIDSQARLRVRPVLKVVRGYTPEDIERQVLSVRHPALSSDKYEAVLMVYRRMNKRRRYSYDETHTSKPVRLARKGWFAALGDKKITDHAAFTVAGANGAEGVAMGLSDLRDFIVKRFMTDNAHTKAELWTRNYAQWAAESNVSRGFGPAYAARKTFGIAVRYVNPSFTALVDPAKPLSPTTMELLDKDGKLIPRYIYSDVAPLTVDLQEKKDPSTGLMMKRSKMCFGVAE
nr:MAG TPA: hypothetical protein [Caudoviricetes sp.]